MTANTGAIVAQSTAQHGVITVSHTTQALAYMYQTGNVVIAKTVQTMLLTATIAMNTIWMDVIAQRALA